MTLRAVGLFIIAPVTADAQSPTDMELSGEGSDVDMIHDDDTGIDPEEEEDDGDEPEPEEVSPLQMALRRARSPICAGRRIRRAFAPALPPQTATQNQAQVAPDT